jgi:hypothetical protein
MTGRLRLPVAPVKGMTHVDEAECKSHIYIYIYRIIK